jgi:murein DD-endopeptidase MepM/ murein hydrolase activator NlpD
MENIMRGGLKKILISVFIASFIFGAVNIVLAEEGSDEVKTLRQQIEERSQELKDLNERQAELEKKLAETGAKKSSLQQELNSVVWQIDQLEVSIESNKLMINKLELEQESLENDVDKIEKEAEDKQKTVDKLFVELQQKENDSFLFIFLKNNTLSESVSEIQSIITLGDNLTRNVTELRNLRESLIKKTNQIKTKKQDVVIEQKTLESRQGLISEQKEQKQYLLAQTENEEQTYEERIAELEKKQIEISNIMSAIEEKLRLTLDSSLLPTKRPGLLSFPVKADSCVTQYYGATEFAKKAYSTHFHTGVDFNAPLGAPIFAAADGKVAVVDNNDGGVWEKYQYGKYVIIEHENNLSTLYAHFSKQYVKEGDEISQGDIIGHSGNTGYSFGAHLHFGVYKTPVMGWQHSYSESSARESGGLISIPPAAGLVPVGATINPFDYLPSMSSCYY